MANQWFYRTKELAHFIIRRDRIRLTIWLLSFAIATLGSALLFVGLYPSVEERQTIAAAMVNPATTAILGPGYGLENYTIGAMMAHQMLGITSLVVGIMSILLIVRHSRTDEEDGRTEMIRSLPTGRLSTTSAAIFVVCGANILLALIIGFGLPLLNIESMDLQGSLLYGASLGAMGIFFVGLTALFAQLSASSRGALGLSFTVLGIGYLVRAIGDVSHDVLSWYSPFGWIMRTKVFVSNEWWPIIFTLGVSVGLVTFALLLNAKRDLGSGFIPSKPGRKQATPLLLSPLGLAFRLQRTGLIAWAIGMLIYGATYGSILGDTESFFEDIEMMQEFLSPIEGFSLTEQFLAMLMSVICMVGTIPALMAVLKLKGEEKNNRTEHLLSRAVSRTRLMGSYLTVALVSGAVMLLLAGMGLGAVAVTTEVDIEFATFISAALVYLPAMWIMIGVAVLFIGIAPQLSGLTWLYLGYSFIIVYLGGLFQFPDWVTQLAPYAQTTQVPIEALDLGQMVIMSLIALLLIAIGFIGYTKRDIEG